MSISGDQVLKVAKLAKLELTPAEVATFSGQLSRIVEFIEHLNEVPTEGVEPMAHAMDVHSVLRDDIVQPGLSRQQALANAPQCDDEFFRVPPVI
jgi:aspartyl-tRNA(Asn)/glutamyl-tRNA(Gln) amidotransferase subunit C